MISNSNSYDDSGNNSILIIRYVSVIIAMFLLSSSSLSSSVGVVRALVDMKGNLDMSFAQWCTDDFCDLRLFAEIGGELLMVDSGSSSLAFCDYPDPDFVTNSMRLSTKDPSSGERVHISQCQKYGATGSHGWYGESFVGTFESSTTQTAAGTGVKTSGVYYTIMQKAIGIEGNQCGDTIEGSIGLEKSTVRGIIGLARNDIYFISSEIDESTWTNTAVQTDNCNDRDCLCPTQPVISGVNSSFLNILGYWGVVRQFAIVWDGTLGKNSGKLLSGDDASKDIPNNTPKNPIETDPSKSMGLWSTNVTGIMVDGTDMEIGTRQYVFDTGSTHISLPSNVFEQVQKKELQSTVVFTIPTISGADSSTFTVTVTQELIDANIFRESKTETEIHSFGLNIMRFLNNVLINFDDINQPYFMNVPRKDHILELPANLPVTGDLAGSESNVTTPFIDSDDDNNIAFFDESSRSTANAIIRCNMASSLVAVVVVTIATALSI